MTDDAVILPTKTQQINEPIIKSQAKSTVKSKRPKRKNSKSFQEAYQTLKNNASALQQQDEPDIDNLMTTVEESISAYKVCQERINAVQQALDVSFTDGEMEKNVTD